MNGIEVFDSDTDKYELTLACTQDVLFEDWVRRDATSYLINYRSRMSVENRHRLKFLISGKFKVYS
jgi:hypothetical protein